LSAVGRALYACERWMEVERDAESVRGGLGWVGWVWITIGWDIGVVWGGWATTVLCVGKRESERESVCVCPWG
jgi:hypothetical protein